MAFKVQVGKVGVAPFALTQASPEESFMSSYSNQYVAPPANWSKKSQIMQAAGVGAMKRSSSNAGSRSSTPSGSRGGSKQVLFRTGSEVSMISPVQSALGDSGPLTFCAGHTPAAARFNVAGAGQTPAAKQRNKVAVALDCFTDTSSILEEDPVGDEGSNSMLQDFSESFLNRSATNWLDASGVFNRSRTLSVSSSSSQNTTTLGEAKRRTIELLEDSSLHRRVAEVFKQHHVQRHLRFGPHELRQMLRTLYDAFGLGKPNLQTAEQIFKKIDAKCIGDVSYDEFLELFERLVRRSLFDPKALHGREFFVHKQPGSVWDHYHRQKELGNGSFGTASLVTSKAGEERVVKEVKKTRGKIPVQDIQKEVLIMQQIDHPHVVRLFEWYEDGKSVQLVLEALKGGTLRDVIILQKDAKKGLPEKWTRKVMEQVLHGMTYCHNVQIMHKDLKDENIMLLQKDPHFDEPYAVIIDLGIAEMFASTDPISRRVGGTPATMAPEVWSGNFGPKCDVWSLGCILYQMLSGSMPFLAPSFSAGAWRSLHRKGPDWAAVHASGESRALCRKMLTYNETARPAMAACLEDPWFQVELHRLRHVPVEKFSAMQAFVEQTKLQRAILTELAAKLPMSKARPIVDMFEALDTNQDGCLNMQEFRAFLRQVGVNDEELVQRTFKGLDANHDNVLSFSEFAAGVMGLFHDLVEDRLHTLFEEYDTDESGCLDEAQAQHFLENARKSIGDSRIALPAPKLRQLRFEDLRDVLLAPTPQQQSVAGRLRSR
eukprot:TRINITY_DN21025_c0_g2_i1.p1 TRINITY_DN21025_c0_g2~~TRINITY_DN21025_c0_g2_i1.p1  ORF type:complete len:771 (-),score=166.98 TRINITY_DN21025_c0_g2_i1:64-2376(-)